MTPCEICGRPVEGVGIPLEDHVDPFHADDRYRLAFECEKSRADALAAKMPRLRPISESPPDPSAPVLVAMANGTWKMSWLDIETLDGSRQGGSMPLGWMPLPEHPGTTGASP